jgi:hypothetical protein
MRITLAALLILGLLAGRASAQSISLFTGQIPSNPVEADYSAVTLGLKFYSTKAGAISGIRFYWGAKNSSGYTARLYSAGGALLAQATLATDSCAVPCWEHADFTSPVSIAANTTYVASYYTSNGLYPDGYYGLTKGASNGPLIAPASSGSRRERRLLLRKRVPEPVLGRPQLLRRCGVHAVRARTYVELYAAETQRTEQCASRHRGRDDRCGVEQWRPVHRDPLFRPTLLQ